MITARRDAARFLASVSRCHPLPRPSHSDGAPANGKSSMKGRFTLTRPIRALQKGKYETGRYPGRLGWSLIRRSIS